MTHLTIRRKEDGKEYQVPKDIPQYFKDRGITIPKFVPQYVQIAEYGTFLHAGDLRSEDISENYEVLPSEENERLRGALRFYANEISWKNTGRKAAIISGSQEFTIYESFDGGSIARAALDKGEGK